MCWQSLLLGPVHPVSPPYLLPSQIHLPPDDGETVPPGHLRGTEAQCLPALSLPVLKCLMTLFTTPRASGECGACEVNLIGLGYKSVFFSSGALWGTPRGLVTKLNSHTPS